MLRHVLLNNLGFLLRLAWQENDVKSVLYFSQTKTENRLANNCSDSVPINGNAQQILNTKIEDIGIYYLLLAVFGNKDLTQI